MSTFSENKHLGVRLDIVRRLGVVRPACPSPPTGKSCSVSVPRSRREAVCARGDDSSGARAGGAKLSYSPAAALRPAASRCVPVRPGCVPLRPGTHAYVRPGASRCVPARMHMCQNVRTRRACMHVCNVRRATRACICACACAMACICACMCMRMRMCMCMTNGWTKVVAKSQHLGWAKVLAISQHLGWAKLIVKSELSVPARPGASRSVPRSVPARPGASRSISARPATRDQCETYVRPM